MKRTTLLLAFIFLILCNNISSQETAENKAEYLPDLDGILKTKVEFDLNNSKMRFEVRNARFGAKGKINQYMSYRAEVDLSDEGSIKMLDAYIKITPLKNLDLYLGQKKVPFSTDYMRNPAENMFANRSFIAKYVNNGLRDIGFYANYKFNTRVPLVLAAGAVNGSGSNNPEWIDRPNITARAIAGNDNDGIRVSGNIYQGQLVNKLSLFMHGEEIRFTKNSFFIESELVNGSWTDTTGTHLHDQGFYIHALNNFRLKGKMFKILTPTIRWDMMGEDIFKNNIDANRLTLGLNAGFEPAPFIAEIRLNFEKYCKRSLDAHTDKVTLEFVGRF